MSDSQSNPLPPGMALVGERWWLFVVYGAVTIALGLVLVVWPEQTLVVVAVLLAIQLIITGVFQLVKAFASSSVDGGIRALLGLSGVLAVLVGLLCLRAPLQVVLVLGLLVGGWLVVSGFVDIFDGVSRRGSGSGWRTAMGTVSVLVGAFLLVNPEVSLGFLVIVTAVWFFGYGAIAIVAGFALRRSPQGADALSPEAA